MACHLFGTKLLSEPIISDCYLDHWEEISVNTFHSRKQIWKCCVQSGSQFVSTPICLMKADVSTKAATAPGGQGLISQSVHKLIANILWKLHFALHFIPNVPSGQTFAHAMKWQTARKSVPTSMVQARYFPNQVTVFQHKLLTRSWWQYKALYFFITCFKANADPKWDSYRKWTKTLLYDDL